MIVLGTAFRAARAWNRWQFRDYIIIHAHVYLLKPPSVSHIPHVVPLMIPISPPRYNSTDARTHPSTYFLSRRTHISFEDFPPAARMPSRTSLKWRFGACINRRYQVHGVATLRRPGAFYGRADDSATVTRALRRAGTLVPKTLPEYTRTSREVRTHCSVRRPPFDVFCIFLIVFWSG